MTIEIKQAIKKFFSSLKLLPLVEMTRYIPAYLRWLRDGSSGNAPPPFKRMVIAAYLRRYQLKRFVETGTYLGDTLAMVAQDQRIQCTSIELSAAYAHKARLRFQNNLNVEILEGDSGLLMTQLIKTIEQPTLFWLDGHYSAGDTARGSVNTPISKELQAILSSNIRGHVVLIDDIRHFNGTQDYPYLDAVLRSIRETGSFDIEVSMDIARFTPRHKVSY